MLKGFKGCGGAIDLPMPTIATKMRGMIAVEPR